MGKVISLRAAATDYGRSGHGNNLAPVPSFAQLGDPNWARTPDNQPHKKPRRSGVFLCRKSRIIFPRAASSPCAHTASPSLPPSAPVCRPPMPAHPAASCRTGGSVPMTTRSATTWLLLQFTPCLKSHCALFRCAIFDAQRSHECHHIAKYQPPPCCCSRQCVYSCGKRPTQPRKFEALIETRQIAIRNASTCATRVRCAPWQTPHTRAGAGC